LLLCDGSLISNLMGFAFDENRNVESIMRVSALRVGFFALVALSATLPTTGCRPTDKPSGPASAQEVVRLNGGGATFVNPLVQKWSQAYKDKAQIDYSGTGSGAGIKQMAEQTLDFGCSDAPMSKKEAEAAVAKNGDVVHIPVTIGAVAMVYNLPGIDEPIKFSGAVIADIYLGKITKWNDPALAALNEGVALPNTDIVPVYRSEGSGTTNIFTEYLSKSSPDFAKKIGISKAPKWPKIGVGQNGSDGVAGHVQKNPGCIGYVEIYYAKQNKIPFGSVRNKAGKDVLPESKSVTAAAVEAMKEKQTKEPYTLHELTYSLTDAAGEGSYPISGMSYALLYKSQPAVKGRALVEFLKWATTEGQEFAEGLEYAPLPAELRKSIGVRLGAVEFK